MPLTTVDQGLLSTNAQYTGFKNRLINGDMTIDQRNDGAAVTVNGAAPYTLDRWFAEDVTDGVFTVQRVADAPAGFSFSARVTITTADASLAAGQYAVFVQRIEGFNFADLAFGTADASPITLSFRVKSSLTGTFGGVVSNSSENYSYPFTYTISSANTWETKSVTIPGATAGTWTGATNANAFVLGFSLGSGSTYTGTPGAWAAADARGGATGQTNIIGTLNATWQVTGVQIEKGQTATSFDVLPYGTELALCQRYYWKIAGDNSDYPAIGSGVIQSTTGARTYVKHPVSMRTYPTFSYGGSLQIDNGGFVQSNVTSISGAYEGLDTSMLDFVASSGGLTAGRGCVVYCVNASTNFLQASAEL